MKRIRLPLEISNFQKSAGLKYSTLFSTNPKTEKSEHPTIILHLAPADTSGKNVCPMAGNCTKICLNFAGNPAYLNTKIRARIRKTKAYFEHRENFIQLLALGVARHYHRNGGEKVAVRLNGTSDILWENVPLTVTFDMALYLRQKYNVNANAGTYGNIFEFFNCSLPDASLVSFYDYTKTPRDYAKCSALGYHLTFSFDGWSNSVNVANCRDALQAGLNVAAAFNLKRGADLPEYVNAAAIFGENPTYSGRVLYVQDGDLSDYRPADTQGGSIIGLRFKLPHGANYTAQDVANFCIA